VTAKDIMLATAARGCGMDGGRYQAVEFCRRARSRALVHGRSA
jgi:homoaconitase/3-isopropylmalate dehydratase large subunit